MAETIAIDGGFGEIRTAVLDDAGLLELSYHRATAAVQEGDIFLARVTKAPPGLDGAFLTLGSGLDAFLPVRRAKSRPVEGSLIPVQVRIAARAGKRITVTRDIPAAQLRVIEQEIEAGGQPRLIRRDDTRWMAPLTDRAADEIEAIMVADPDLYGVLRSWCRQAASGLEDRLTLDRDDPPLFERLRIEDDIDALFEPRLTLPGGGALTIEDTTAGTVIDVDTGTAGGNDMERVALSVNTEAARAIARQLRLRRVGGLVFIDFVTLRSAKARSAVLAALDDALAPDPTATERTGFSRFGVVELNRARRGTPLMDEIADRTTQTPAPGADTQGHAILRALERASRQSPGQVLMVDCDPPTAHWLETTTLDGAPILDQARGRLHADIRVKAALGISRWSVYTRPRN